MKKWFSGIFVLLLTALMLSPVSALAAKSKEIGQNWNFWVYNNGELTKLYLEWEEVDNADYYELYRSKTGKEDSYTLIATVDGTRYEDDNLKKETNYYYKMRAAAEQPDGSVQYSDFLEDLVSTGITKEYAQKKLRKAYKVADKWMSFRLLNCDTDKCVRIRHKDYYTKKVVVDDYYPVVSKNITSMRKLEKYLCKYFSKDTVQFFIKAAYYEKNEQLYMIDRFDETYSFLRAQVNHDGQYDTVEYITGGTVYYDVLVNMKHENWEGETWNVNYLFGLYFENGRWVYGDSMADWDYGEQYWNYLWHFYQENLIQ